MDCLFDGLTIDDAVILHLDEIYESIDTDEEIGSLSYLEQMFEKDELDDSKETLLKNEFIEKIDEDGNYTLTKKGKEKKENLWKYIRDKNIILIDNKDTICLMLENVRSVLDDKPIIELLEEIEDNVLDLRSQSYPSNKLVDRDDELEMMKDALEDIFEGRGNTFFIVGDKGIGKTRLVYEIKEMSLEKDFDFLRGESLLGDYNPYRPFKDALKKLTKIENEKKSFSNIISDVNLTVNGSKEMFDAQRKSIFYETTKYVQKLSEFRPLVIFLDDLQWADKGTLNLLDYMADKLQDKPVLFIGAYRPGDVTNKHPLKETMNRMSRKKLYEKIELEQLNKSGIGDLVKGLTDFEEVPEDFIENMKDKTKGNPLFIEESIKQMMKEGLIDKERSKFPTETEIVLTSDIVQDVISRRITNFDNQTRKILQLGSVIGRKVPFDLLADASEVDELELLDIIDYIMESRLWLEHTDEESFVFYHDLFVETVYDGLGKWLERKNYHKRVAHSIENVYDDLNNKYSQLAYHYKNAEEYEESSKYYHKAGKRAEEVYAHEDAIERYKESIKMANISDSLDDSRMFCVLEDLSDALSIKGEYKDEMMYLKQAMSKTDDLENKRRLYRKIAKSYINQGEYKKAIEIIEKGLNLGDNKPETKGENSGDLRKEKDFVQTPETCRLLSEKGWVMMRLGRYGNAKKIFTKELELAEEIDHKPSLSQAYHDLGSPARANIDPGESIRYLNKSIEIRDELIEKRDTIEDKLGKSKTFNNIGAIYSREGKLDKALEYFKRSIEIDDETNIKLEKGRTLNNIGYILVMQGKLDQVLDYLDRGQNISEKIGDKQGLSRLENSRSFLQKEKGNFDQGLDHINNSLEIAEEIDDIFGVFMCQKEKAELHILKGDLEKAKEEIERSEAISSKLDNDKFRSVSLSISGQINREEGEYDKAVDKHKEGISLAENDDEIDDVFENRYHLVEDYLKKRDLEKAQNHLERLKEENLGIEDMESRIIMVEGILKREEGEFDRAEDLLKRALDKTNELSKEYRIARIYHELGKLYLKQDDYDRAEENLNEAKKRFEDMGMELSLDRCLEEFNNI